MAVVRFRISLMTVAMLLVAAASPAVAQVVVSPPPDRPAPPPAARPEVPDSVTIRLVDTDLRSAVQIMGQYLDRAVVFSGPNGPKVSLQTPHPVPKSDVVRLLRGLLESQEYELVTDTAARLYRVQKKEVPKPAIQARPAPREASGSPELFVVALKHARAVDVAQIVNALYGHATSLLDTRARTMTLSDQLRGSAIPPLDTPLPQSVPGTGGRSANLTGEVTIVPDAGANSLIVRANRTDFQLIQSVVDQLDVRPLQVLIEVTIAEVRRDRTLAIGTDATLNSTTVGRTGASIGGVVGNGVSQSTASGTSDATSSTSTTNPITGLGDFALQVMGLGALNLDARLQVAAERGDVKILSRPVVVAANNQQASIVVGSQRPFVQVSRALPTDNGARDQVVQYKDVGTKLTVTPTISTDGLVQLEVTQEVSNATTETAFNAPVISTRSVQTQLLIRDGQTVALGGLTDHENDASQGGVPILSAIPVIGGLFGHASRQSNETELFIFLTPHVIRSDAEADSVSAPYKERAKKINP